MDRSEEIVRATLNHVFGILRTAAQGAQRQDDVLAQAMNGTHSALVRKTDEIVQQVLEKL